MLKKEIISFYLPIFKKYKIVFFLLWLSWVVSWLLSTFMPLLLKLETDQLVDKKSYVFFWSEFWAFDVFIIILLTILIIELINEIFTAIMNILITQRKDLLENEIRLNIFKKMENMEVWVSLSARYKFISDIVESNFWELSNNIINFPKNIFNFIISFLGLWIVYAYLNYKLFFIVIISAIISYFIDLISDKVSKKYRLAWEFTLWRQVHKYSNLFFYDFSNLAISWWVKSTLKTYEDLLILESKNKVKMDYSDLAWSIWRFLNFNIRDFILKLIVWYWVFVWTWSVWMVVLVVSSMWTISSIISDILGFKISYRNFIFHQEWILLMLKMSKSVWEENLDEEKINNISFKNIMFSYPNLSKYEKEYIEILQKNIIWKKTWKHYLDKLIQDLIKTVQDDENIINWNIFTDLNITFQKWKVYWIVWKNWAWKTTLMYLLSGFFREYTWEILINNQSIKNLSNKNILDKVSFLTQVPFLLDRSSSIKENLFLWVWVENATQEKAYEYLEKFWLAKKIKKHPKWLDAEIGRDLDLSGWEKQIIVFIRLLLQDREVIIMDEWTNQLDAENEVLVMNELMKYKDKKIIIFITHRMSTISKADEIYCLENWAFSHTWSHKELLAEWKNAYARFYKAQVLNE